MFQGMDAGKPIILAPGGDVEETDPFKDAMLSLEEMMAEFENIDHGEEKDYEPLEAAYVENLASKTKRFSNERASVDALLEESARHQEIEAIQEENRMLRTFTESFRDETVHLRRDLDEVKASNWALQNKMLHLTVANQQLRRRAQLHQSKWSLFKIQLLTNLVERPKAAQDQHAASQLRSQIDAFDRALNYDDFFQAPILRNDQISRCLEEEEKKEEWSDEEGESPNEERYNIFPGFSPSTRQKLEFAFEKNCGTMECYKGNRSSPVGKGGRSSLSKSALPNQPPLKQYGERNRVVGDIIWQDTMLEKAMQTNKQEKGIRGLFSRK